jgi:homocysteine S-methyltransferase
MQLSVVLAIEARNTFLTNCVQKPHHIPMVAASLGPYGAALADGSEYRGYNAVSIAELIAFHEERLKVMGNTQADMLAFETIPCLDEAIAIKELLRLHSAKKAWVSFSCKDGKHLSSGELFADAVQLLTDSNEIIGIGVNCTAPQHIESLIKIADPLTNKVIIVYPNKGETYNAVAKIWEPNAGCNPNFIENAKTWINAGAKALGGCCRTNPADIHQLGELVFIK